MPDDDKPIRMPIFTSYVFPPGTEVGGGGGHIGLLGGVPRDALYVVYTYQYEGPEIVDLNEEEFRVRSESHAEPVTPRAI